MPDIKRIGPKEAFDLKSEGFTYVDVRSEPEFADGHPEGAINVPISLMHAGAMQPNTEFLGVMEATFSKDAKIVVGCKMGGRSARAAAALSQAGFSNVKDQRAGWDGVRDPFGQIIEAGWSRAGLPSETGDGGEHSYAAIKSRAGA
jgi:rhodanese-related sulfurtransferase